MVYRDNSFKGATPTGPRMVELALPEDLVKAYRAADKAFRVSVAALEQVKNDVAQAEARYFEAEALCGKSAAVVSVAGVEERWRRLGEAHAVLVRAKKEVAEWRVIKDNAETAWMEVRTRLLVELVKAADYQLGGD